VRAIGKQTMRQFDNARLTPVRVLSAKQIKALRRLASRGAGVVGHAINASRYDNRSDHPNKEGRK